MARCGLILAIVAALTAASHSEAHAQLFSRGDLGSIAQVLKTPNCPLSGLATTVDKDKALGTPLDTFFAQVAGDTVSAAASALGAALEQAARERTFAATGQGSFDFYKVEVTAGQTPTLAPSFGVGGSCLLLVVPSSKSDTDRQSSDEWDWTTLGMGLVRPPALYVELEMVGRPDGFSLVPRYVAYREALDGAPDRALPAEIQVTFATPGPRTDQTDIGTVFAVARIPLPPLAPQTSPQISQSQGIGRASVVLPPRPTSGTPADFLLALTTAVTARDAQAVTLRSLMRARAQFAVTTPATPTPEQRVATMKAEDAVQDANASLRLNEGRVAALGTLGGGEFGATNVQARLVLIRNENGFLKAIAKSLQDHAPALGTGVTTGLTPEAPTAAWTALDTIYVTTMNDVLSKQAAMDAAIRANDQALILSARLALRNAEAAANAAAAASGRALPYPGLI